jgi:transposase
MRAIIHAADIQDRDGGALPMGPPFGLYPFLLELSADRGYQGPKFQAGLRAVCGQVDLEIAKRSDCHRFVVLPKRRIVERTIGWLNRCRRLAKDWDCLNRSALACSAPGC